MPVVYDGIQKTRGRVVMAHLRAWRLWAGLSRDDLAAISGVSAITLRDVEWGATFPRLRTVARIAAGLGVPVDVCLRYAPSASESERWAREVAVKFARERATRPGRARNVSNIS